MCPFNRKVATSDHDPARASRSHPGTAAPSLIALLETTLDPAAWDAFTRGSALRRAGRAGLGRNVCVALGNWGSPKAVPVLSQGLQDPEPLIRAHSAWALGRVGTDGALAALTDRLASEETESVREEIERALDRESLMRK